MDVSPFSMADKPLKMGGEDKIAFYLFRALIIHG